MCLQHVMKKKSQKLSEVTKLINEISKHITEKDKH